jgi:hypothetical protein
MRLFLCIALIVLLPSVHSIEALCYKLRWRLADPIPPERIIRPVTGISVCYPNRAADIEVNSLSSFSQQPYFDESSHLRTKFQSWSQLSGFTGDVTVLKRLGYVGDSIPAAGLWSNTGSLSASSCATGSSESARVWE